jgi:hypothetical protein
MWRYTAGAGMSVAVLLGEKVLHQLVPRQELFAMIAAGAIDLRASFRRAATGHRRT